MPAAEMTKRTRRNHTAKPGVQITGMNDPAHSCHRKDLFMYIHKKIASFLHTCKYCLALPAAFVLAACAPSPSDLIHVFSSGAGSIPNTLEDTAGLLPSHVQAAQSSDQISEVGFYFDTVIQITLNGTQDESILKECFALMSDYENMLSRTRENSDVWNINHSNGAPTKVCEDTAELLKLALHYSELSDGAFDVTIAPVSILWDFQGEEPHQIPSDEALAEALSHVDYRQVELDGTTVTLKDPDMSIDLGGIAKGYIADRIRDLLIERGVPSGFIDLGGNILAFGEKPNKTPWKIGIRKPFGTATELIATVTGPGRSVVTSGTYERYFELDGTLYHHILNPSDGYPVENGLYSVTILSESSADGDALSTTCFSLGLEKGMELIESLENIESMFITDDLKLHRSSGFPGE